MDALKRIALLLLVSFTLVQCGDLFLGSDVDSGDPLITYDIFYDEVDSKFSFFEYLDVDFDSAYQVNRQRIIDRPSSSELTASLTELINVLQDGHSNVFFSSGGAISYTGWYDQYPENQLEDISGYFSEYKSFNNALDYGIIDGENIGYIKISTFTGSLATSNYLAIDDILDLLWDTDGIIIDVRSNGGGNSNNADIIVSRFNDEGRLSFRARRRLPDSRTSFTGWWEKITDVYEGDRYLKPVAVLSNRRSFSSTEWFISGMRTIPHATIIGDTTGGGSGNPILSALPNGWGMRVSNTQKELPEGRDYQYTGIYPDIPVWISTVDAVNGIDTILERAIQELR